jgi:hypothetical protein
MPIIAFIRKNLLLNVRAAVRQGDAQVFKKYSQMKLQMKREAQGQLKRQANETQDSIGTLIVN